MVANGIPHLHNQAGVARVRVSAKEFMCIGALPPFDHPHIFIDFGSDHDAICPYCSTVYSYNPDLETVCEPTGCIFTPDRELPTTPSVPNVQTVQAELITVNDRMSRDRRFATYFAGVATIYTLFELALSVKAVSYVSILIWFFLFFLSLFHFVVLYDTSITQKQVKMIDYLYLLAAGFAIFLAFVDAQRDREKYLNALDEFSAPSTTKDLQTLLQAAEDWFCVDQDGYTPQNFCQLSSQNAAFLAANPTEEQLTKRIDDMRILKDRSFIDDGKLMVNYYCCTQSGRLHLIKKSFFGIIEGVQVALLRLLIHPVQSLDVISKEPVSIPIETELFDELVISSMEKISKNQPDKSPEFEITLRGLDLATLIGATVGLGKVLIWPFALAIALALRLTKVTADVFNLAKA